MGTARKLRVVIATEATSDLGITLRSRADGLGVNVVSIEPGLPFAEAGLAVGDCILAINRQPVKQHEDAMSRMKAASILEVDVKLAEDTVHGSKQLGRTFLIAILLNLLWQASTRIMTPAVAGSPATPSPAVAAPPPRRQLFGRSTTERTLEMEHECPNPPCARHCRAGLGGPGCNVSGKTVIALHKFHDPYAGLQLRPNLLTGWSETPDQTYIDMVELSAASIAVEVGVWRGLSASHIAQAMKARGNGGILFCVDTWLGAIEFWNLRVTNGKADPARDLFLQNGYPSVYYNFLSNMVHAKVSEYVVPMPMTSRMAADLFKQSGLSIDLIHSAPSPPRLPCLKLLCAHHCPTDFFINRASLSCPSACSRRRS